MRHNKKFNHLSRKKAHRDAMLANMTSSLILSPKKRIFTTLAKAKALRVYAEPLINRAKPEYNTDTARNTANRRLVFSHLQNKHAVKELFSTVANKIGDRPGGFTRILKVGNRLGDNAKVCFIELVDFNEALLTAKAEKAAKKTTRRSRRSKKAAPKAEQPAQPAAEEATKEATKE